MHWSDLHSEEQLSDLLQQSFNRPQVIFKHSTRCSLSELIKTRLEKSTAPVQLDFHYLDLIKHRSLSNKIATQFDVWHESPQVLLIQNGECVFDESHLSIYMEDIIAQANTANNQ
jgi:bacillithiol system protein YtxJ